MAVWIWRWRLEATMEVGLVLARTTHNGGSQVKKQGRVVRRLYCSSGGGQRSMAS